MRKSALNGWALPALSLLTFAGVALAAAKFEVVDVTAAEAAALLKKPPVGGLLVLDVRTPGEYADGHLEGAVLADFKSPVFESQLEKLDRSKPVLLYCRTGNRSGKSLPTLRKLGFGKVYHFTGGITEWRKVGHPEEKGPPKK